MTTHAKLENGNQNLTFEDNGSLLPFNLVELFYLLTGDYLPLNFIKKEEGFDTIFLRMTLYAEDDQIQFQGFSQYFVLNFLYTEIIIHGVEVDFKT